MKHLVLMILLAVALPAHAVNCIPNNLLPALGSGTDWKVLELPKVKGRAWFCKLPVRSADPSGQTMWSMDWYAWHNDDVDIPKFAAAASRVSTAVLTSTDPLKLINDEMIAARVPLVPGSQKEYEYKEWKHKACLLLQDRANWPANVPPFTAPSACIQPGVCTLVRPDWPVGITYRDDVKQPSIYEVGHCGPAPVPPVVTPPTETWATPAAGTFRLYTFNAGRLATIISGRTAGPNQTCNCSVTKILSSTQTYCPVVAPAPQTEVTLCFKRVP